MRGIAAEITRRGGELVLIGNGTAEDARRFFAEAGDPPCRVVVDPQLVGYRAAHLKRDVLLGGTRPRTFWHWLRARRAGFRGRGVFGDPRQLGGVFVIAPGGEVRYSHVSRSMGDHPPALRILQAVAAG